MALAINDPILTPEQEETYWAEMRRERPGEFAKKMREAWEKLQPRPVEENFNDLMKEVKSSDVKSWKDLSKPVQQALCTHQSGHFRIRKMPNGECFKIPHYCGHCEKCLKMQAKRHKQRFEVAEQIAREKKPEGQWTKKGFTAEQQTEKESYKKQVARKGDSMHCEVTDTDKSSNIDDWVYVWEEAPDTMGEPADPNEIDWDKVNRKNKKTGGKTSYGKGIRPPSKPAKENTEKLVIPEIVVSARDYDEAEKIVYRTNLLHKATTMAEVQDGIIRQTIMEIEALQKAGIKVCAVYDQYLNLEVDKTIEDWNRHVSWWMSRNGSDDNSSNINRIEPKTDKQTQNFQEYNLDDYDWLEGNE